MVVSNAQAATLYWDANGAAAGTGGDGNWDTTSSLWRVDSDTGALGTWTNTGSNNDAVLAGTTGTATLTSNISVNDITAQTVASIAGSQTLTLNGTTQSVIDVASGSGLSIVSGIAGVNGITKNNTGLLILDGVLGSNGLLGPITVNGGTLRAGSTVNNAASQVLRSNAVSLAAGTSLTTGGSTVDLRVGALSGSGSVTPATGGAINIHALQDATFSGAITTTGGLNLRGGNGTTQTFSGNLTGLTGTIGMNGVSTGSGTSSAVLTLSGNGALGNSALVELRGGSLVLDNTNGNTGSGNTTNRLGTGAFASNGGVLSLLGNAANGSLEAIGSVAAGSGTTVINVTHNGGSGGTVLTLGGLTYPGGANNRATLNFTNSGGSGTLGTSGANPRILITAAATGAFVGEWATVNGGDYAFYDTASTGVKVGTYTNTYTTIGSANPGDGTVNTLNQTTTTATKTGSSAFSATGLRINPGGSGRSLDVTGTGNLNVRGILLAGADDYTISSSSTGGVSGPSSRYIGVANSSTTLTISATFKSAGSDIVKYGDGFLNLTGANNGTLTSGNTALVLNAGTLRGSLGTGIPTSFVSVAFRGGVLEISNGANGTGSSADFKFGLGTAAGNVNWDNGSTDRGSGGFSAITNNASVNIGGNATPTALTWDTTTNFVKNGYSLVFGSTKADKMLTFINPLGLDNGTATNSYFAREIRVADNSSSTTDVARLSGIISGSANADLLKTGAGVLELTNTNTYSGNTLIQQGTLIATNGAAIANTSAVVLSNTAGATFQLNNSETIGALSGGGTTGGNVNIQGNTLTVGDQRDSTFGGVISGNGGALTKQGTGTLSLTAASNTYSGATSVSAGSLFVNGSLANTTSTSVSANATLAANGTIANGVSIASSGRMAIGADDTTSTIGSVTVGSMALSGSLEFGATDAMTYDKLISTGALAVTGGTIAFKTSGYTVAFNTNFDIVDFGSFTGTPTFDFSGASVQQYGAWDTSAFASTGVISYVPEPSSSVLLGACGALALLRRRR